MPGREVHDFDELLLSRVRMGILCALAGGDELDFVFLRETLRLTDGNLGAQIRNLEGAGYIRVSKRFVDRKPRTYCRITMEGHAALRDLLRQLECAVKGSDPDGTNGTPG